MRGINRYHNAVQTFDTPDDITGMAVIGEYTLLQVDICIFFLP
jgi:hypothetical protein